MHCVPEKGGALRNQSTGGRRLGVAAAICGVVFGAPLLLLQNMSATVHHAPSSARGRTAPGANDRAGRAGANDAAVGSATGAERVKLHSHLVAYQAPTTTTTTAPVTTATGAPLASTTVPQVETRATPATTTTLPPPAIATTTTAPPPPPAVVAGPTNHEAGEATWYSGAAPGGCASPTLPFGTVLTVVNNATGASTQCTVDDRELAGYPRVVDMSPEGFSEIASMTQGVVDVTISW